MNNASSAPPATGYVFPRREQFEREIAKLPTTIGSWAGEEGPRFRLELSPGSVRITSTDLAKKNRAEEAARDRLRHDVDMLVAELKRPEEERREKKPTRGTVKGWSLKSRSRMTLRLATLDYSPLFSEGRPPAMLTGTMPGDWESVAPTAKAYKKIVNRFRARYEHAWRTPIAGVWKMEFQKRGAPHLHIISTPPQGTAFAPLSLDDECHLHGCAQAADEHSHHFRDCSPSCSIATHQPMDSCRADDCEHAAHTQRFEFPDWFSRSWAASVGAQLSELRNNQRAGTGVDYDELTNYADPKRIGVYFSKHGLYADKEYQNAVPELWKASDEGGAHFWGYWVLRPMVVSKETHEALIMHIVRHLRALADRQSYSRVVTTKWVREDREVISDEHVIDVETGEVTMQPRSTWVTSHRPETRKRKVRRRVKRWRSVHGFEVVNDSLAMVDSIVRVMQAHLPTVPQLEGYAVELLDSEEPDFFGSGTPQFGQDPDTL